MATVPGASAASTATAAGTTSSFATYAGLGCKAFSIGMSIYGAIQSAKRHAELLDTLKKYHDIEMGMLNKIYAAVVFGNTDGKISDEQEDIANFFGDIAGLSADDGARTPAQKQAIWLADAQHTSLGVAARLRNVRDVIQFDPDNPDGSYLDLYCNALGSDKKKQSKRFHAERFWNGLLSLYQKGQIAIIVRIMMEIDQRNKADAGKSDAEWAAMKEKPEISEEQIRKVVNSEWDGTLRKGYTDLFVQEFEELRDAGFQYLSKNVSNRFDCRAATDPSTDDMLKGRAFLHWDCDKKTSTSISFKVEEYEYSILVITGDAKVPDDKKDKKTGKATQYAVVGLEFVKGYCTRETFGRSSKKDGLSLRIHYTTVDKILHGDSSNIKTRTITTSKAKGKDRPVDPTGSFWMDIDTTDMVNLGFTGKKINSNWSKDDHYVVVGAGLRRISSKMSTGLVKSKIRRLELVLQMRKYDKDKGALVGDVKEDIVSTNTNFHRYIGDNDFDKKIFSKADTLKEKFSKLPSLPKTISFLNGAAIKRDGSVSYLALYSRYTYNMTADVDV